MQWSWKSTPFPSTHGPNLRRQYGLKIMSRQEFCSLLMNAYVSGASSVKKSDTEKGRTSQPEVVRVPAVVRAVEGRLAGPPSVLPRAIPPQDRHAHLNAGSAGSNKWRAG